MDTNAVAPPSEKLSTKLLKAVLLTACVLGLILSLVQVALDGLQTQEDIDLKAAEMMAMVTEPSVQALQEDDANIGQNILNGLLAIRAVQFAAIEYDDGRLFASVERGLFGSRYRVVSDRLFTPVEFYRAPLMDGDEQAIGELILALDTAHAGKAFIQRSAIVVLSGFVRAFAMAMMMYFIYTVLLTRPLNRLITTLTKIDPKAPGQQTLPMPLGHENNELGTWVRTANALLDSINHTSHLQQRAEARVMRLSQYDYLTRLPNRLTIQNQLSRLVNSTEPDHQHIAILCMGLDDFKAVNAQVNFNVAEHVLVNLTERLRTQIGSRALIGKLGEDQFVVIMSGIEQAVDAAELAQEMLAQLVAPFSIENETIHINASVGITLYPNDGRDVDRLLQQAELAMIIARTRSRNRYQFYLSTVDDEIRERKRLELDLHNALDHNEFSIVYQPQFDYEQKQLIGVEALLRWNHPDKGLVSPDDFIPMAEHNLDIIPIGNWVLDQACQQLKRWHDDGFSDFRMGVNLSAIQLQDISLVDNIDTLLERYNLPARSLELEVTETSIIEDIDSSRAKLEQLKKLGVKLALDDFGTGYSSLSYLKTFPFDKIKIDKTFVDGLPERKEDMAIVSAVVQISKGFGFTVLAEGVETDAQEHCLIELGCQEGQGYLYGKPGTAQEMTQLLHAQSPS